MCFEDILILVLKAATVGYIRKRIPEPLALVAISKHGDKLCHRRESNPRSPTSKTNALPMGAGSITLQNVAVALVEKVCLSNFIAGGNG